MPTTIAIVSSKGGVGKTTTTVNLGGILAAFGMKVLLIDADVQPSLSKSFELEYHASHGLSAVIRRGGSILEDSISRTRMPNLDIVYSDADGTLQAWLSDREDRLIILRRAIRNSAILNAYNVILIDTQGAAGWLQNTAAMAANLMLSPIKPDILSAREFSTGTLKMLSELNSLSDMSPELQSGDLYALINDQERTNNSRDIANSIRLQFAGHPKVRVLTTQIPHAAAYPAAMTQQIPVHAYGRDRQPNSAWETMHRLVWELFPELNQIYVDEVTDQEGIDDTAASTEQGAAL
jgi:chromosome partitioning related protein ParA